MEKHEFDVYDLAKSAVIIEQKDWIGDGEGLLIRDDDWLKVVIDIFDAFIDLAPVLMAQAYLIGHGCSVRDPYSRGDYTVVASYSPPVPALSAASAD